MRIRRFLLPFSTCAFGVMLAACVPGGGKALSTQSTPTDIAAGLSGKWMLCQDGFGIISTAKQQGDIVQMIAKEAKKFDKSDCSGKGQAAKLGEDEKSIGTWLAKIQKLDNATGGYFPVRAAVTLDAVSIGKAGNVSSGTEQVILYVKTDGSSFKLADFEFKRAK